MTARPLFLFNTLTRKKEKLKPLTPGKVKMYTCGPTVYDFAHIGNFRTYVFEDLLRRTIKLFGYDVIQVMNITDVDDKTIRGATKLDIPLNDFTKTFTDAFFEDVDNLGIERAEYYPKATNYIEPMIHFIESLLKKGAAYKGQDGSVYFNIKEFPSYGCLSHLKLDELKEGASARVACDEYDKDHVADFVLWKSYDPERDGKIFWESPFGKGRPGWHLECSTMAMQILGKTLDIHCGGVDNMFPHHENEIAQSETLSEERFCNHWLHSEHLLVENRKMSKSLGNFYSFRDLLKKGYSGTVVRYMLMQTHYKTQLNFTFDGLDAAKSSIERIDNFISRLQKAEGQDSEEIQPLIEKRREEFLKALGDDLNISEALAALFELIREGNALIDNEQVGEKGKEALLALLKEWNEVLNVMTFESHISIPQEIQEAHEKRLEARKSKEWAKADELRAFIEEHGFEVEDSPKGSFLKPRA